ncbi:MAG TPA: gamma carbonic anhydrase family protein [Syntrophorhabdaceae bacterium]|nr:gamma carbonic anhydrase family protein [Syntrophorhabdaceae bacterium]
MLYAFDGFRPEISTGAYVSDTAVVIGHVKIGENSYIGHGAIIRGDYGSIDIGPGTAVEEGAVIHAPPNEISHIGERVTIGHGAIIHSSKIGDYAVIGMGAVLSIHSEIGTYTIIAEGGIVKMRQIIPDRIVAGGNPVKVLRDINENDIEFWNGGKQVYVDLAQRYLSGAMEKI